jgi:hypothetical protein
VLRIARAIEERRWNKRVCQQNRSIRVVRRNLANPPLDQQIDQPQRFLAERPDIRIIEVCSAEWQAD